MGRHECQVLVDLLPHFGQRGFAGEHFVHRQIIVTQGDPEVQRGMGLRIQIDQTDLVSGRRDGRRKIDCGSGLPYPTLLVHDGDGTHRTELLFPVWSPAKLTRAACGP